VLFCTINELGAQRRVLKKIQQADIIMLRTNGVAVFPVTNAIGTIVQAAERSDVDTVMVAGRLRNRTNLFGTSVPVLGVPA